MESKELQQNLLKYGIASINVEWPDYVGDLSLTEQDVKNLFEILRSNELELASDFCTAPECLPMHAWRAIGQLRIPSVIPELFEILQDDANQEAYWFQIEFPLIIKEIGAESLPIVQTIIQDEYIDWYPRSIIAGSLKYFANTSAKTKGLICRIIIEILEDYKNRDIYFITSILKEYTKIDGPDISALCKELVKMQKIDFDLITIEEFESLLN